MKTKTKVSLTLIIISLVLLVVFSRNTGPQSSPVAAVAAFSGALFMSVVISAVVAFIPGIIMRIRKVSGAYVLAFSISFILVAIAVLIGGTLS